MALSRRAQRRGRHVAGGSSGSERRAGSDGGQTDFATAGEERDLPPGKERVVRMDRNDGGSEESRASSRAPDETRDPKTLNDFDPNYGKTYASTEQNKGGVDTVARESYGRGGEPEVDPEQHVPRTS